MDVVEYYKGLLDALSNLMDFDSEYDVSGKFRWGAGQVAGGIVSYPGRPCVSEGICSTLLPVTSPCFMSKELQCAMSRERRGTVFVWGGPCGEVSKLAEEW